VMCLWALPVASCGGDDKSGGLEIRYRSNPTTTTTLDREGLGLNTDVLCVWRGIAFSVDKWAKTSTAEERARAAALLGDNNLSQFFIHATEAQTREACELFDGQIVEPDG